LHRAVARATLGIVGAERGKLVGGGDAAHWVDS